VPLTRLDGLKLGGSIDTSGKKPIISQVEIWFDLPPPKVREHSSAVERCTEDRHVAIYTPRVMVWSSNLVLQPDCGSFQDQKDCEAAKCKWDGDKKQCDHHFMFVFAATCHARRHAHTACTDTCHLLLTFCSTGAIRRW